MVPLSDVGVCGFSKEMLLNPGAKAAFTRLPSPAPDGPGSCAFKDWPALMLSGNPVRQLRIGYRLHPLIRRFGPEAQARSKGKSQPR